LVFGGESIPYYGLTVWGVTAGGPGLVAVGKTGEFPANDFGAPVWVAVPKE